MRLFSDIQNPHQCSTERLKRNAVQSFKELSFSVRTSTFSVQIILNPILKMCLLYKIMYF